jgi:hypothetical protein
MRARLFSMTFGCAIVTVAATVHAGLIADENTKRGFPGGWPVENDGSANGAGRVDVYPAQWSIKSGDAVHLKIRSTTGYSVRVFRTGWYQGYGATQVKLLTGLAADPQPGFWTKADLDRGTS